MILMVETGTGIVIGIEIDHDAMLRIQETPGKRGMTAITVIVETSLYGSLILATLVTREIPEGIMIEMIAAGESGTNDPQGSFYPKRVVETLRHMLETAGNRRLMTSAH